VTPFPGFEGGLDVAMGDVDDDGVLDLIVGSGKDHAPEVVAYSGRAEDGKAGFETELARFRPFAAEARGGVSVAAAQIDGTSADNIIVGSGPGILSEVRVFGSELPSSPGTAPALFSTFSPYADDVSGVSIAAGFVDFATGRNSIVTAPGPGSPAEVKVFAFPLFTPTQHSSQRGDGDTHAGEVDQPANTAAFMPFGDGYRGGVSLGTGWLAGSLGGAERIVIGQLAGAGTVKVFSSGSALDGGPSMYLHSPSQQGHGVSFDEIATFRPFNGVSGTRVATTSTTSGANLLVSGIAGQGRSAQVLKYELIRPNSQAATLEAVGLGEVFSTKASQPVTLGGD
jgi:hypothetical protein